MAGKKGFHPVKRPGALTRKATKAGMSPQAFARKNYHAGGLKGEQARFAVIARKWAKGKRHGGHGGSRRSSSSRHKGGRR